MCFVSAIHLWQHTNQGCQVWPFRGPPKIFALFWIGWPWNFLWIYKGVSFFKIYILYDNFIILYDRIKNFSFLKQSLAFFSYKHLATLRRMYACMRHTSSYNCAWTHARMLLWWPVYAISWLPRGRGWSCTCVYLCLQNQCQTNLCSFPYTAINYKVEDVSRGTSRGTI